MPTVAPREGEAMAEAIRKPRPEARTYRERIRELVEQDRVGAARALLAEALEDKDHGEDLSHWQSVLAPAKVLSVGGEPDIDRTADFEWLKDHADSYRGQWVALLGGELLAHSASLDEVVATLKKDKLKHPALLEYIHHPPEVPGLLEARTYAEKIRAYVEADCVGGARALLAEALEKGDHGEDLSYWQKVLAPAEILGTSPELDPDRTPELEWLAAHGREYRGQWVALAEDRLLAHSQVLDEVLSAVKTTKPSRRPLLHYIQP